MGIMAIMACLISKLQIWVPFEESARIRNIRILRVTIRIIHVQFGLSNYHYNYPSTIRTIRLQLGLSNYNWDFSSTIRIIYFAYVYFLAAFKQIQDCWHCPRSQLPQPAVRRGVQNPGVDDMLYIYIYIYYYIPKKTMHRCFQLYIVV